MSAPAPPAWTPGEDLVADARLSLALAPDRTPQDRFEAAAWRALLDGTGPAVMTRGWAPFHMTASAVVLTPDAAFTCLVLHHKIDRWVQPGGHLEAGDRSLAGAAAREVAEETGLVGTTERTPVALSRHRAPCAPGVVDWHLDVQHVLVCTRRPPRVSDESRAVAWWPVDGLPAPLADGVEALVRQAVTACAALGRPTSPR